jgi:hypothetical protein
MRVNCHSRGNYDLMCSLQLVIFDRCNFEPIASTSIYFLFTFLVERVSMINKLYSVCFGSAK